MSMNITIQYLLQVWLSL